tara:strand:- start:297 stop:515 length:219 start_codon:yes stop_codon:yes gene_type:complete
MTKTTSIIKFLESMTDEERDYLRKRDEIQWNYGFDSGRLFDEHKAHDGPCECAEKQCELLASMDKKLVLLLE